MFTQRVKQASYLLAIADATLLVVAYFAALATRTLHDLPGLPAMLELDLAAQFWLLAVAVPAYLVLADRLGLHRALASRSRRFGIFPLLKPFGIVAGVVAAAVFLVQSKTTSRGVFVLFLLYALLFLAAFRVVIGLLPRQRRGSPHEQRVGVIVGTGDHAVQVRDRLADHPEFGYRIAGFLDPETGEPPSAEALPLLGTIHELEQVVEQVIVDDVFFAVPVGKILSLQEKVLWCEERGLSVHLRADFVRTLVGRIQPNELEGLPFLSVSPVPRNPGELLIKRAMDLFASGSLLLVLSPLLIAIAAGIKATSPGPVLFRQRRVGLNGRIFTMLKFRSMYADAEKRRAELLERNEATGPVFKIKKDPRITPLGHWLRRTSLDELPQLWNVFVGEMSLVGPRPPIPEEVAQYEPWQRRRLSMRPGITCIWQVSGRAQIGFEEWMKLDLRYIDSWSLMLDLKILAKTIPAVVTARGAH